MAAGSDTIALAAEERAKQGKHELEISFGGELDLHKHYNSCQKNPGHHNFIPINKLETSQIPKHLIPWVVHMSGFTVKLSVHYVSPNRPPKYPLSDRAGQRVLSVGSGYLTHISPMGKNGKMSCPLINCDKLPGNHEVYGYITVVTAAHVVFDDEEAKNTTVEFFYDDSDDKSGVVTERVVKVASSSVEGDFCELLCVIHDIHLCQRFDYFWRTMEHKRMRICHLFRRILPALENIKFVAGKDLTFLIKIRMKNLSEAIEALVVLGSFTEEIVDRALQNLNFIKSSLCEVLRDNSFKKYNLLAVINFELQMAELIYHKKCTVSFTHLHRALRDLRSTVMYTNTVSPETTLDVFMSLISELAQYYSTVESLEERLSLPLDNVSDIFNIGNKLKVMNFSNGTAAIEVSLLRRNQCSVMSRYIPKKTKRVFPNEVECDWEYIPDLRKSTMADTKYEHSDTKSKADDTEYEPNDTKSKADDTEYESGDIKSKIDDIKYESGDTKSKADDTEYNSNDVLLIHIAHPHGQSKQVTIGRQTNCFTDDGFYHQLYTAPTCPGCSGGPVWMIPASGDLSQVYGVPHSGHLGNELNMGCSWNVYPPDMFHKYPTPSRRLNKESKMLFNPEPIRYHGNYHSPRNDLVFVPVGLLLSLLLVILKAVFDFFNEYGI